MDTSTQHTVKAYVIFTKSKMKHWLMRWLHPNFQHVYIMYKSTGGQLWIILNPTSSHIHTDIEYVDDYPHPRVYAGEDAVVLPIKNTINLKQVIWGFRFVSCTEIVKAALGIKKWYILTPYQLYKYLTNKSSK